MAAKKTQRSGRTVNRSVSFTAETLRLLERRAKRVHGGNLSAAIAEAARLFRMQEAREVIAKVHDELYGPLTSEQIVEIDAEEHGLSPTRRKRRVA